MVLKPVRVRFAPSPTGHTHLGSGRTALYNYLLARQTGGQFILRLEDTDRKRYVPNAETELAEGLRWLGLEWDEGFDVGGGYGPYRQSERRDIYLHYAKWLVDHGHAYYCFCSPDQIEKVRQQQIRLKQNPRYDRTCRLLDPDEANRRVSSGEKYVIRFKVPDSGKIVMSDLLRGNISVENQNLDDSIIVKSDGLALYHLAAMVDDHLMKITHVIRGSEWLSTFPLHAHIVRAFGWSEPIWVHLSLFLKPSGKGKMSKRDVARLGQEGYSIFLKDLENLGYLPEAVVNWIALMGWSYDDRTELFSMKDLIEKFSLERCTPSPAAINFAKLDYFNGTYIRSLTNDDLTHRLKPYYDVIGLIVDDNTLRRIVPLIQERIVTLDDAPVMSRFLLEDDIALDPTGFIDKDIDKENAIEILSKSKLLLVGLESLEPQTTEIAFRNLASVLPIKLPQLFRILRLAITGQAISPPLIESMAVIGKERVLKRIDFAIESIRYGTP